MRPFDCQCGARIFFDNSSCLTCGRELGFSPESLLLAGLEPIDSEQWQMHTQPTRVYRRCASAQQVGCNWLLRDDDEHRLCLACRLNHCEFSPSNAEQRTKWARVEAAKRRLIYSLIQLRLPVVPKAEDPARGIAFDVEPSGVGGVLTGYADGIITLKVDGVDPGLREQTRVLLNERYRNLLGHYRHEVGHYYWDQLIRDSGHVDRFRVVFGDERLDYAAALRRYHELGAASEVDGEFVSSYANSHPWEDWAETWAHYLHLIDTLETAESFASNNARLTSQKRHHPESFEELLGRWHELTVVLNALNRSMGMEDAYPRKLGDGAKRKIAFVHQMIQASPGSTGHESGPISKRAKR